MSIEIDMYIGINFAFLVSVLAEPQETAVHLVICYKICTSSIQMTA